MNFWSAGSSSAEARSSGRRRNVRSRAFSRRQRAIFPWSPDRRTSGTRNPANSAGRVVRAVEKAGVERVAFGGVEVAQDSGKEPGDGVDDAKGEGFSPRQHEVAEGQFLVDEPFGHPLVDSLVAPAQ